MSVEKHDWSRSIRWAQDAAVENARRGVQVSVEHVMWELMRDAAIVSGRAFKPPPHVGFPSKSSLPDGPEEVTMWHKVAAYIRGELDEMPTDEARPPMPSTEQVSRADAVLWVWHNHALRRKGDAPRIKKAVYLKACGVADRKVRAVTGMTRQAIHAAKAEAMRDMWEAIKKHATY